MTFWIRNPVERPNSRKAMLVTITNFIMYYSKMLRFSYLSIKILQYEGQREDFLDQNPKNTNFEDKNSLITKVSPVERPNSKTKFLYVSFVYKLGFVWVKTPRNCTNVCHQAGKTAPPGCMSSLMQRSNLFHNDPNTR